MPRVAILDPELTLGLSPKLTAATGMDAMAHCIESYCAPFYHPLAAGVALEGLRLVRENLARAVRKGTDIDARGHMLMASTMGATAFQRGLGAIHPLSHPFGGLYDAHHGMLNGIIMPYVVKANRRKIDGRSSAPPPISASRAASTAFSSGSWRCGKRSGFPHRLST